MDKYEFILTNRIAFEPKPEAVPYHYRLSYKVSLACLILGLACGRSGCSLSKMHLIIISMYSAKEKDNLLNYVNGKNYTYLILRYDPTINKTIDFMLAENIIFQQGNGLFRLTDKGKAFLQEIMSTGDLLSAEKKFLEKLSNKLSEKIIESLKNSLMG